MVWYAGRVTLIYKNSLMASGMTGTIHETKLFIGELYFFLLFMAVVNLSCNSPTNKEQENDRTRQFELFYGKEIRIPKTDLQFVSDSSVLAIKESLLNKRPCIISIIEVDCGTCLLKLESWRELIKQSEWLGKDDLILILLTSNPTWSKKYYSVIMISELNLFIDSSYSIVKLNQIPGENRYRTFLLDENNRIVVLGEPFQNEKMLALYSRRFKEHNK